MSAVNPYDCTRPGNLFVGYDQELSAIVAGLQQHSSFDLVGGRQCGKTSLLKQIERTVLDRPKESQGGLLPRYIDMHAVVPRSPAAFFEALDAAVTRGLEVEPWVGPASRHDYQAFLQRLREVDGALKQAHGPTWKVVLLLDELDAAAGALQSDECFQNLRNLVSVSDFRSRILVVGSAAGGMDRLIWSGSGSPLNVLHKTYTRGLKQAEVQTLIRAGFEEGLGDEAEERLLQLSGGHVFILQALLSYLWDLRDDPQPLAHRIQRAVRRFIKDRSSVLQGWLHDIGPGGSAVYDELQRAPGRELTEAALRARLGQERAFKLDEVLCTLACHGLVDDTQEALRISGELFRTFYASGHSQAADTPSRAAARAPTGPTSVFVIHGRHEQGYDALKKFLHALGLKPMFWSDVVGMTGKGTPSVLDVLDKAFEKASTVVVLFTPDDEARLLERHAGEYDEAHERELRFQPRANVLIEAGMALTLFRDKTLFVQLGKIRPVSDLAGLQFVRMDNSYQARLALKTRLEGAGLAVDPGSTAWLTAGDFIP